MLTLVQYENEEGQVYVFLGIHVFRKFSDTWANNIVSLRKHINRDISLSFSFSESCQTLFACL